MVEIFDDWHCDDLDQLQSLILENGFRYEIGDTIVDGIKALYHPIQDRIEETNFIPKPRSHLYHSVMKIVYKFCFDKGIDFQMICRSSINYSHPKKDSYYPPHVDHDYDHKSILIYLNDCDGDTLFWDENQKETHRVSPKKNRVVLFDGKIMHSVIAPTERERVVLITTIA